MLNRREHRQNSDSWGSVVRACPGDSGLWHGVAGRDRGRREEIRSHRKTEQLLRANDHQDAIGLYRDRNRHGWDGRCQRTHETLANSELPIVSELVTTAVG